MSKLSSEQNVELPDSFSSELRDLLEGLLHRDVDKRLGCKGRGYVGVRHLLHDSPAVASIISHSFHE